MEFHFVKLNVNGTYLSLVDPSYKPRYMCFQDMLLADKCLDYVSMFRSKHGVWPSFNMSRKRRKLESVSIKKRTPEQLKRYLEIETYDFRTMDMIATRSNISFYNVLRFDTREFGNIESVDMSGQEMDAMVDDFLYRDLLEYNLKVN